MILFVLERPVIPCSVPVHFTYQSGRVRIPAFRSTSYFVITCHLILYLILVRLLIRFCVISHFAAFYLTCDSFFKTFGFQAFCIKTALAKAVIGFVPQISIIVNIFKIVAEHELIYVRAPGIKPAHTGIPACYVFFV
ncbi:MAG: hypothetical protein ACD_77C00125G0001 [uncultured bacterium]|nr:MAG: hypothetical protein ACD_77C00125G0001 [uncultured bacterium]